MELMVVNRIKFVAVVCLYAVTMPTCCLGQTSDEDRQAFFAAHDARNAMIALARDQDLDAYKAAVAKDPSIVNLRWRATAKMDGDSDGMSALHYAAENADTAMLNFLITKNANVHVKTISGDTPLHFAANKQVALALLDAGANVQAKGNLRLTPLHHAATKGVAEVLWQHGAKIGERNDTLNLFGGKPWEGCTPLQTAARDGRAEVVQFLIDKGADVNVKSDGWSALATAASGNVDTVKVLLAHNAEVNGFKYGASPLYKAVHAGRTKIVKLLLKADADATIVDQFGWTLLHVAALNNRDAELIDVLIKAKVDMNAVTSNNKDTAMHIAAKHGSLDAAKALLSHDCEVNGINSEGKTALMLSRELEEFKYYSLQSSRTVEEIEQGQREQVRKANDRRQKIAELIQRHTKK